jgi:O-antigen ligase
MGVGANHYVAVAKHQGYSERAGVIPAEVSRNAIVHNAYLLATAETGYLGIAAFLLLLTQPLFVALVCGWRNTANTKGDLLLGLCAALAVVYLHSFVEWILLSAQIQYLFAITVGMIAGLAQQLGYWRHAIVPLTVMQGSDAAPTSARPRAQAPTLRGVDGLLR